MSADEYRCYRSVLDLRFSQRLYVMRQVGDDSIAKLGIAKDPAHRRRNINADAVDGRVEVVWHRPLFTREYVMPLRSPKPTITWTEHWLEQELAAHAARHDAFPNGATEWYMLSPDALVKAVKQIAPRYDIVHLESPKQYAELLGVKS
jgi:hypothetical protein